MVIAASAAEPARFHAKPWGSVHRVAAEVVKRRAPLSVTTDAGTTVVAFTVTLTSAQPNRTYTVNYTTANGSAVAGSDYIAASGTLHLHRLEDGKWVRSFKGRSR